VRAVRGIGRRSIRLPGYDYSQPGAYFVTVCADGRRCIFGEVAQDRVVLGPVGAIVAQAWDWLPTQYPYLELDTWMLMPNHLHGILILHEDTMIAMRRGGSRAAPTQDERKPLGQLIGAFKTVSTKEVNRLRGTPGAPLWQRGFYEHIIRNENDLVRIREYTLTNPAQWSLDRENPDRAAAP
jgi:REP element-mobilizing transposase RayT